MMRNPNIAAGRYQKSLRWEPGLSSPQGSNEVPQSFLPPPHDMSGNDIENLDFYFHLVVTNHPTPLLLGWCQRRPGGEPELDNHSLIMSPLPSVVSFKAM